MCVSELVAAGIKIHSHYFPVLAELMREKSKTQIE